MLIDSTIVKVMPITIVYGEQRGDEAKGRFAASLAQENDIVARFNGGQNAGHTSFTSEGKEIDTHIIPSGITEAHVINIIGNGTVIDPIKMFEEEVDDLHKLNIKVDPENLLVSSAAHIVLPHHISQDERREKGKESQGSTKFGISYTYSAKVKREGIRVDDALTRETSESQRSVLYRC